MATSESVSDEPALVSESDQREPSARVRTWRRDWPALRLGLIGEHQAHNAAVAVAAVELLGELGLPVGEPAVREGLAGVQWPARLEVLRRRPDIDFTVAFSAAMVEIVG